MESGSCGREEETKLDTTFVFHVCPFRTQYLLSIHSRLACIYIIIPCLAPLLFSIDAPSTIRVLRCVDKKVLATHLATAFALVISFGPSHLALYLCCISILIPPSVTSVELSRLKTTNHHLYLRYDMTG